MATYVEYVIALELSEIAHRTDVLIENESGARKQGCCCSGGVSRSDLCSQPYEAGKSLRNGHRREPRLSRLVVGICTPTPALLFLERRHFALVLGRQCVGGPLCELIKGRDRRVNRQPSVIDIQDGESRPFAHDSSALSERCDRLVEMLIDQTRIGEVKRVRGQHLLSALNLSVMDFRIEVFCCSILERGESVSGFRRDSLRFSHGRWAPGLATMREESFFSHLFGARSSHVASHVRVSFIAGPGLGRRSQHGPLLLQIDAARRHLAGGAGNLRFAGAPTRRAR